MKWFLVLLTSLPFLVQAQVGKYTFIEDRQFLYAQDLAGYTFIPYRGKLSNAHFEDPVKEGLVQFSVTTTGVEIIERVTFSTGGISGENESKPIKMSIPRIDKKAYGFEVVLMDMRNPNIQGYLQFYANRGYIHTIKYKPEPSATERTYFVLPLPDYQDERDSKFFTHDKDHEIADFDNVYGERIYPFAMLKDQYDYREFSRLFPGDRVWIEIETRSIQKKRKEKEYQYLILNDPSNKENPKMEFLIKKEKETTWKDRIYRKEREVVRLTLIDETNKVEHEMFFYRQPKDKKLTAIRYQDKEYLLRQGLRK
jgi:hypothetical protein